MPVQNFYIKDDVYAKISQEKNRSEIIDKLLRNYYSQISTNKPLAITPEEIKRRKETFLKEAEYLKELEQTLQDQKEKEIIIQEKEEEKLITRKNSIKGFFKEITSKDMSDEEYIEYINMLDNNMVINLMDYIKNILKIKLQ